jgi:hypothetical protein
MSTSEELERSINERLARGPVKKKRPEPSKPIADVIPLPQGQALSVAKQERTRASEIDRVLAERLRRAEALVASEAYQRAGERFNAGLAREREDNWFDPTQPFGFRR